MHKWTDQECETVCSVFKAEFVNSNNSLKSAIVKIKTLCPDLKESSIGMKIFNTIYLCDEFEIEHNCEGKPLEHYSQQHLQAFKKVFGV